MDIGSILILVAMVVFVGAFVLRPLRDQRSVTVREDDHQLSHLLAERDRLLNALMELDFDHDMGKISEEAYPGQRASMVENAASVLKQLDELQGGSGAPSDQLEAVIAARKGEKAVDLDDPLEAKIAARRSAKQAPAGGDKFCPNCGSKTIPGDRFCSSCGAVLE